MKKKALEKQRLRRNKWLFVFITSVIVSTLLFVMSHLSNDISPFIFYYAELFAIIFVTCSIFSFIKVISILITTHEIKNLVWPVDWCYSVEICIHSLNDINFKKQAQNLRIRYVNDKYHKNQIQYEYTLNGKEYSDYVTIDLAKELFYCYLFKYL